MQRHSLDFRDADGISPAREEFLSTKDTKGTKGTKQKEFDSHSFVSFVDINSSRSGGLPPLIRKMAIAVILILLGVSSTHVAAAPAWSVEEKSLGTVAGYDTVRRSP